MRCSLSQLAATDRSGRPSPGSGSRGSKALVCGTAAPEMVRMHRQIAPPRASWFGRRTLRARVVPRARATPSTAFSLPQGIMPISMTWPSPHQNTCAATARNSMHGGQTRAAPMVICDVVSTHCHCHAMHRDLWCPRHERHATRCCLRCIARKRREQAFKCFERFQRACA